MRLKTFQISQTHHPHPSTSPVLPLSPLEPTNIEPTNNSTEQTEKNNTVSTSLDTNDVEAQIQKPSDLSISTPPPSKKKYDIMNDPAFLTSPLYPPLIYPNDSISTQRNDALIQIFSHENFTFK